MIKINDYKEICKKLFLLYSRVVYIKVFFVAALDCTKIFFLVFTKFQIYMYIYSI